MKIREEEKGLLKNGIQWWLDDLAATFRDGFKIEMEV